MPVLKKVFNKQIKMEMDIRHFLDDFGQSYLLKTQLGIDFGAFQRDIIEIVQERLNKYDEKIEEKI